MLISTKLHIFVDNKLFNMNIYGISFSTTNYGSGVALIIAANAQAAFNCLKASGKLNSIPQEYKLLEATVLAESCLEDTTLVYENYSLPPYTREDVVSYKELSKIEPYLYKISYDNLDYEYAEEYFRKDSTDAIVTGCSSFRFDDFFGRNLDWYYSNSATFVVEVPRKGNRFASIGVAGSVPQLTDSFVSSRLPSESYKILPFYALDGINEYSVFCNTNVVPIEDFRTTRTVPEIETKRVLCSRMLPRFILDNFTSASAAVNYIRDYVSVYFSSSLQDLGYETHLMVGDKNNTYIVEFINNSVVITEHNIMTNFIINGVTFNNDGTVYTQESSTAQYNPVDTNNISLHGAGLERYNIVATATLPDEGHTKDSTRSVLDSLVYTNAYKDSTDPFWCSEYVDKKYNIDLKTPIDNSALQTYIAASKEAFNNRSRNNPITWQTVHSSLYDINAQKLYLKSQENNNEYTFNLN